MSWRSNDVYFFGNELASVQDQPNVTSPHLNAGVKSPDGELSHAPAFPPHKLARNLLLFSLGVVAYWSTLKNMLSPIDLDKGRENRYTEFFAARRLEKFAKTDMGGSFHQIIEKLVECDFDPKLQAAFHQKPEQKLHDFRFD